MSGKASIKERAINIRRKLGLDKQEDQKIQKIKNDFNERTAEVGRNGIWEISLCF